MNKKSFTILELLVVISVLVILIGVDIPRIKGMQDAANITQVKHDLITIQTAIESYCTFSQATKCDYTLGVLSADASTTRIQENLVGVTPNIISSQLNDPFNPTAGYGYWASTKCYVIFSKGPAGDCDAGLDSLATIITNNYNHSTGVFNAAATCSNMLYVTNNSRCT